MNATQQTAIETHGRNILAIFPNATEKDPVNLCKKIRRLEAKAASLALRGCNGPQWDSEEEQESAYDAVLGKVNELLGNVPLLETDICTPIFINRDPRGYQLKIMDSWFEGRQVRIHRDWGGYGIICPEIK